VRILLTGGHGLVGRPLAERLSASHDVVVTDMPGTDVTSAGSVRAAIRTARPDHVVHLAAWTDVDGCEGDPGRAHAVNAEGTAIVARAAAESGAALLYVSTDYVYDGHKAGAYVEDDPVRPLSEYGRSKLAGEAAVREHADTWCIARCQSIYGRGKKSFVDAVLARARAGEPLRVVTDQRICPSYADEVAGALAAITERAAQGLYLVASSGSCTWWEFARAALDLAGFEDTEIAETTAAEFGRAAERPANSSFDCSRLVRATGHSPRHWRDALAAYLTPVRVMGERSE